MSGYWHKGASIERLQAFLEGEVCLFEHVLRDTSDVPF